MRTPHLGRTARLAAAASLAAALVAGTFVPATTAVAETADVTAAAAAAASAPVIYNGLNPDTSLESKAVTGGNFLHGAFLQATDAAGNTVLSNRATTGKFNASSIIDADQVTSLAAAYKATNATTGDLKVSSFLLLPKYSPQVVLSVDTAAFDANGLRAEYVSGFNVADLRYAGARGEHLTWAQFNAQYALTDLMEVWAEGTLAAGASGSVTVPLALPDLDAVEINTVGDQYNVTYGEAPGTPFAYVTNSGARFAEVVMAGGVPQAPFIGGYLPALRVGEYGNYSWTVVPELQSEMPTAALNKNYWLNNYATSSASIDIAKNGESALYSGGRFKVLATEIADAVRDVGYDTVFDSAGNRMTTYNYVQRGVNADVYNPDGSSANSNNSAERNAPYVSVRQVVAGNSASIRPVADYDVTTSEAMALKVYDHEGAEVALDSADVEINGVPDDTTVPGSYPITVKYLPDNVWKTVTLQIEAPVFPTEPPVVDNQIVIPEITGVDYLIDGQIVTGTISVPEGETVTVSAVAEAGYFFGDDVEVTSWDYYWVGDETGMTDGGTTDSSSDATLTEAGAAVSTGGDIDSNGLIGLGAALAMAGAGAAAVIRRKH